MFATEVKPLGMVIDGRPRTSALQNYADIYDPSTGTVIARAPMCTAEEVDLAVQPAKDAFAGEELRNEKVDTWDGMLNRPSQKE